ncbi:precorrin-6y C5,15-methyltransferase (decarboxylating) subunit CbiE [Lutispora saccharofermentans]|uniref:Precorrin-6y C5,15-methyltransferase (Decarboxylating) subunit CbiE n=1 Tax=Lutispora saccharofermentans TaxID=3024236 RepID=A0ABT1NAS0_9FIRM|nr:precorrin-6y C5,15-methyltransferase (decarboxylating) subunit CbiE [Lutispora saccharofermentans]
MYGVIIAGIGPGNPDYLTMEVKKAIEEAEHIIAFGRAGESLKSLEKEFIKVKRVDEVIDYIGRHKDALLLASGDPCFYGITDFLKAKSIAIERILPGISSFQYMMTKLKKSWQGAQFLSLHGREEDMERAKNNRLSIILTDDKNTPSQISQRLKALGAKGRIYAGYNLSYDDERIIEAEIGENFEDISPLAVVVVEDEMD